MGKYLNIIIAIFSISIYSNAYCNGNQNRKSGNTTESKYKFGKVEICLKQIKGNYLNYCSASLEIKKGGKVIQQRKYNNIDPLGGAYGLFVPSEQPSEKYFMINKLGDYNGRTLLIDKEGYLIDLPGGLYFVTKDKRLLFIEHEQDCCNPLNVYDLQLGKIVFRDRPDENSSSKYGDYESIRYCRRNQNIYVIFNFSDDKELVYRYDYENNSLFLDNEVKIKVDEKISLSSQIKVTEDCHCENSAK